MAITLYTTADENHVVLKTLNQIETYNSGYSFKDDTSVVNPVVLIKPTGDISTCNYIYISDFHRYYYITDIVTKAHNLLEIHGHVDVLYTYRSAINNMDAIVIRNEFAYNNYLQDNVPTYADKLVVAKGFPTYFNQNNASFILITAGGG